VVGAGLQSVLAGGIPNALRRAAAACSDPAAVCLAPAMSLHVAVCGGVWLGLLWLAHEVGRWTGNADAWPVMAAAATELLVRAGLLDPSVFILNVSVKYDRLRGSVGRRNVTVDESGSQGCGEGSAASVI